MTCCIAFAAVIAFLRAAWLHLTGTSTRAPSFAPVARRSAPTSENAAHIAGPRAADLEPQADVGPGWIAIALQACGLAMLVYALAGLATAWLDVARFGLCSCCTSKAILLHGTALLAGLAAFVVVSRGSHRPSEQRTAP